jgi:hypothetical protein
MSSKVGLLFLHMNKNKVRQADEIDSAVDAYMNEVKQLPQANNVNFLVKALSFLIQPDATVESALASASKLTEEDLGFPVWSTSELAALREYVDEREDDLEDAPALVPNRTMSEIVNWFYMEQGCVALFTFIFCFRRDLRR